VDRYARLNALLAMLAEQGKVEVDDAVRQLGVSPATVRRDLVHLHEQGMATRTHGGAVAKAISYDLPLRFKSSRAPEEKARIGQAAASLIQPGATVGLNGGTTALEVGRALAVKAESADKAALGLTVVTNAINLASELLVHQHRRGGVTGGMVRARSFELFGPLASKVIAELAIDTLFLGVNGFDPEFGASAYSDAEAQTNSDMVAAAKRCVVVADSSKIPARAFARICPPSAVDLLVTDSAIDPAVAARINDAGIEVMAV
jgi:DeoR family transcriptional regulator of aga operon